MSRKVVSLESGSGLTVTHAVTFVFGDCGGGVGGCGDKASRSRHQRFSVTLRCLFALGP